ncbi:DUF3108 domain-containing protein [Maricaulis maris]|uniref:Uncharacterized protein DUF3108 n=1 Tax=Maricaulis maris TaxID=74318 RepID=A0A495D2W7_9PROT|nr:DUF3108 domain-containing protein [Maricaulis maris]RKQ96103.1 uncharacterized protein DUF3108 [Maricaulis maris]
MQVQRILLTAGLALALATGMASGTAIPDEAVWRAPAVAGETRIEARYASSVLFFKVGEITLNASFGEQAYSAGSHIEAAGLAALFADFDIRAEVSGEGAAGAREPSRYTHVERTGDKVRSVAVDFAGPVARSDVEPPFGSWGVPPASESDRTGVIDPMTAFFELSRRLEDGEGCQGRLPVFDGKARYDLRLETVGRDNVRTRGWRGEALVCHAWYEPIAGYDPEDYPSERELRHPLVLWLAPVAGDGAYLPVRLHTRAGFGGVTIELMDLAVG